MSYNNYPIIDDHPMSSGINRGLDLYDKVLHALFLPDAMKTSQQLNEANLKSKQISNQYLPNQLSLDLESQMAANDNKSMQNKYQEQLIKSALGLQEAQTKKMSGLQSYPGQMFQDYQKLVDSYGEDSSQANQFKAMMDSLAASRTINDQYRQSLSNSRQFRMLPEINRQQLVSELSNLGLTMDQIPGAVQLITQGYPIDDVLSMYNNGVLANNPDLAKQQYNESQSSILKKGMTTAQMNQRLFSDILSGLIDKIDPDIESITKFSGTLGKTGGQLDKMLAALGSSKTDPDYLKFDQFMNVELPLGANELRRTLGGQATDYEAQVMNEVFNPTSWAANPEMALNRWKTLKGIIEKTRSNVYKNPSEMLGGYQNKTVSAPRDKNISLVEAAGINPAIPTFKSKEEFQSWYADQSPDMQEKIKKKLGGQ